MTQPLLSISNLPEMVRCFAQNLNETTVKELEGFLQSDELRYIPVKAMRVVVSEENAEWAVRIYLNQQDKIDRNRGKFHGWMMKMCGVR